jgi:crotonobetainyl-CoA:carnitine CoA-transferase CaiB-like acyl-CoA transferase
MAVDQGGTARDYSFPPRYGEQSEAVLREVGYGESEIAHLHARGILAGPDAVKVREARSP